MEQLGSSWRRALTVASHAATTYFVLAVRRMPHIFITGVWETGTLRQYVATFRRPGRFVARMLLERISSPQDVKDLEPCDLPILCEEIRRAILVSSASVGGHIGPIWASSS